MSLIKTSFVATLESLKIKELTEWDNEHKETLDGLEEAAEDARADLAMNHRNVPEAEDSARNLIDAIDKRNQLASDRKQIERRWKEVMNYAEGNL